MINLNQHINLLGFNVKDRVTGFSGVVSSVCFDLYGCIQAAVNPGLDNSGKLQDSHWFDVNRLQITSQERVMDRPEFEWDKESISSGLKGPAERPSGFKP